MFSKIQKDFFHSIRFACLILILLLACGCNQEKPVSYRIPKENRAVNTPTVVKNDNRPTQMPLLPGMKETAEKSADISYQVPDYWEEIVPWKYCQLHRKSRNRRSSRSLCPSRRRNTEYIRSTATLPWWHLVLQNGRWHRDCLRQRTRNEAILRFGQIRRTCP